MAPKGQKASSTAPSVIGFDIGKEMFHLVGFSPGGEIVFRRMIKRQALADTFKSLAPCLSGQQTPTVKRIERIIFNSRARQAGAP